MKPDTDRLEAAAAHLGAPNHGGVDPAVWHIVGLTAIVLSLVYGAYLQSEVLLGSDVGWLIRSVGLMFDGQRFGADIFELNFPVMWYLCMPAAWGIEYLGLTEVSAIRLWVWVMAAASLLLTHVYITPASERSWRLLAEFSAVAFAVCVLVGPSFGQREHLAFMLSLPYVFVVRLRSIGSDMALRRVIVAGALAGIAISIKPFFLVVPLVIELSMLVAERRMWKLVRHETLAIAIAGALSVCCAMVLAPEYLNQVVPVAYATYWAYDNAWDRVLEGYPIGWGIFLAWFVVLLLDWRIARSSIVWFAAFLGWTASYFFQRKGFDYHGYPAMACAFALSIGLFAMLAFRLQEIAAELPIAGRFRWEGPIVAGVAMFMFMASKSLTSDTYYWFRASTEEDWPLSRAVARKELISLLDTLGMGPEDSVFVLSTHPFPAFPTLNYLGAKWVGPDMAQFPLPAWFRKNEVGDEKRRQAIDVAMAVQRQHVRRAVLEGSPDYILLNKRSSSASPKGTGVRRIDYFAIFGTDPELANAFARYGMIGELRDVQIYLRNAERLSSGSD
jgi:hypothetical protein